MLIQACIFSLFCEKPPPILLFKPVRALETAEYTKILKGLCQLLQLSGSCLTPKLDSGFHPGLGQIKEAEHQRSALPREVLFQIPNS